MKGSAMKCLVEVCKEEAKTRGLCSYHYGVWWSGIKLPILPKEVRSKKDICTVEGCGKPYSALGYCNLHYSRFKAGRPLNFVKKERKENYEGYMTITSEGYNEFRVKRHGVRIRKAMGRIIAGYALDRELTIQEEVHHDNGIRWEDVPSNLAVCPNKFVHSRLDILTQARKLGVAIPYKPNENQFSELKGVIWVGDLISDDDMPQKALDWYITFKVPK